MSDPFIEQHQASIALLILFLMFGGFIAERQPPAVVAACGAAVFMVLGFVDTDEVMGVLGNGALATIAAMFVLSGALVRTGALEAIGAWITSRAAQQPMLAVGAILAGAMLASAFMNNTPVTLVLIPVMIHLAGTIGCTIILVTGCIDLNEAVSSVDGSLLGLIFGMLVIGEGLDNTGAVALIVSLLGPGLEGASPLILLFGLYLLSAILTEIVTNNAVAALMTPIAIGLAEQSGVDPRPLVVAVMFAASASFATPIGYQTNTLVYGAGNYRFSDFLKIGIPMNLIAWLATCTAISLLMPL